MLAKWGDPLDIELWMETDGSLYMGMFPELTKERGEEPVYQDCTFDHKTRKLEYGDETEHGVIKLNGDLVIQFISGPKLAMKAKPIGKVELPPKPPSEESGEETAVGIDSSSLEWILNKETAEKAPERVVDSSPVGTTSDSPDPAKRDEQPEEPLNTRPFREWTAGRFSVEARLVGVVGPKVRLLRKDNGSIIGVNKELLSEADRDYIQEQIKRAR